MTTNITMTTLNGAASGRALFIEAVSIEAKGATLASGLLKLAGNYQNADAFDSYMAIEAKWIKSAEGKAFLDKQGIKYQCDAKGNLLLPAHFMQTKSNILVGWRRFGMNPAKYTSINSWNVDLQKFRKENRPAGKISPKAAQKAVEGMIKEESKLKPEAAQVLQALAGVLGALPDTEHDVLVSKLQGLVTQFRKSIDSTKAGKTKKAKKAPVVLEQAQSALSA